MTKSRNEFEAVRRVTLSSSEMLSGVEGIPQRLNEDEDED
jgi:hypothetical protein